MRRCCTDAKHGESATGSAEGCGACGRRTLPLPGVLLAEDAGDASDAIEEPSCDVAEPGEPIGDDACAQQRPANKSEGRVSRAHTVATIEPCAYRAASGAVVAGHDGKQLLPRRVALRRFRGLRRRRLFARLGSAKCGRAGALRGSVLLDHGWRPCRRRSPLLKLASPVALVTSVVLLQAL